MTLTAAALIGLRDALTGAARAGRVRGLALPSWLSTRPVSRSLARARRSFARNG